MVEAELALYSSAVSNAALWAVAQNSIRHLVEADDHFKKQRYASVLASAVLSIEETGKLHFLAFMGKSFDKHQHNALIFGPGHDDPLKALGPVPAAMQPPQPAFKRAGAVISPIWRSASRVAGGWSRAARRLRRAWRVSA